MKLKEGFIVRKIVKDTVLMNASDTGQLLRLNETAADILALLEEGLSEAEIAGKMAEMYEVAAETAQKDVAALLENLKALGALDE